jgi:hypothetical protein
MSSPYKTKIMRLEVDGVTVDTVELATLEVAHSGNVESKYGQDYDYQFKPRNRHAIGMKRCRFTIRKWYKADGSNTDLFYTLFDNDTVFTLKEYLVGPTGFVGLEISECEIYTYTPTTGAANDIIQEEIVGEGLYFSMIEICLGGEQIVNGDFETGDLDPWINLGVIAGVIDTDSYSGTYSVEFSTDYTDYGCGDGEWIPAGIRQTFNTPIETKCVECFRFAGKWSEAVDYAPTVYVVLNIHGGGTIICGSWAFTTEWVVYTATIPADLLIDSIDIYTNEEEYTTILLDCISFSYDPCVSLCPSGDGNSGLAQISLTNVPSVTGDLGTPTITTLHSESVV